MKWCLVFIMALTSLSACATSNIHHQSLGWAGESILKVPSEARYSDAEAVILLREQRLVDVYGKGRGKSFYKWQSHEVIAILKEGGIKYANVRVPYSESGKILTFKARTITATGEIRELKADEIHDDKTQLDPDEDFYLKVRTFRLPKVEVGSIIEYYYTIKYPFMGSLAYDYISDEIPIERYKLELIYHKYLRPAVKVYRIKKKFKRDEPGDMVRLTLRLRDIPASKREPWGPSRRNRDAWWNFRVKQFATGGYVSDWRRKWEDVVRSAAAKVYDDEKKDKLYKGFEPKVDLEGCKDAKCKIDRARIFVRDETDFDGFGGYSSARSMKEVLRTGYATNHEKTFLLYGTLKALGFEARVARLSRYNTCRIDKSFPSSICFNHSLVYLPRQKGLDGPLWLDPSCEQCEVGQLPSWDKGQTGLVMTGINSVVNDFKCETEWIKIEGELVLDAFKGRHFETSLDVEGNAEVKATVTHRGESAFLHRANVRKWDDKDWEENASSFVSDHGKGSLDSQDPSECEDTGECRRKIAFDIDGYATRVDKKLIIPLSMMDSGFDGDLWRKKRKQPIHIPTTDRLEESVRFKLPSGFEASEIPKDFETKGAGLVATFKVKIEGDTVTVTRTLARKQRRLKAEKYSEVQKPLHDFTRVRSKILVFLEKADPVVEDKAPDGSVN